jgi:hypothetical protein
LAEKKRGGLVATAAIIALLVAVVGIGIANYYLGASRVETETTTSLGTTTLQGAVVTKETTKTSFVVLNYTTTAVSSTTVTTVTVSTTVSTPSTTVTIAKTVGNISQITTSEAVLYSGNTATASSGGNASLLIGFYNPNASTYVTSIILESPTFSPIFTWDNSSQPSAPSNQLTYSSATLDNSVSRGLTSVFNLFPATTSSVKIVSGQTYQYLVFFASGAFVQGSLTAQ